MPRNLSIERQEFELLGLQRGGAAVYRGDDSYLRIGPKATIERDLGYHRKMEAVGFPVAPIISEGRHAGKSYFIESSMGPRSFAAVFAGEYAQSGSVSDESFQKYQDMVERVFQAQLEAPRSVLSKNSFSEGVRLPLLMNELQTHASVLESAFAAAFQRLSELPAVITHGDLNPANAYERGIIDLEDSFFGPLGFDVVAALVSKEWSPEGDYEPTPIYRFSESQKRKYLEHFDTLAQSRGVPVISRFFNDLSMCRGIWLSAGMSEWPKTQKWRFDKLERDFLHV